MDHPLTRIGAIMLLVAGALVALSATVVTFLLLEAYASTARVSLSGATPATIAAEVEKITSDTVLD